MNSQRRRSPQQAKRRKAKRVTTAAPRESTAAVPAVKSPNSTPARPSFLKGLPKGLQKGLPSLLTKSPAEMKTSIRNVRQWSSQMRGTMAQMEQTLDTLTNLIGMYERWTESSKTRAALQAAGKSAGQKQSLPQSFIKTLNNVDFRQIINLLNSPLVQALLEMDESAASGENKEG